MNQLSKDQIKERLLKRAAKQWGYSDIELENVFDPIVNLLFDVCAKELEKIAGEIYSSRRRMTERLIDILTPTAATKATPARGIARAYPVENEVTLNDHHQFYYQRKETNPYNPTETNIKNYFFGPTIPLKLTRNKLRYVILPNGVQEIQREQFREVINSNDFIQLTKALIRYHYSEWIYNEEFGGDHYCSLLFSDESLFFNVDRFNPAVLDELSDRIYLFGGSYDSYQSGVSLFSGYYDTYKLPLLESIKTDLDSSILKIERQLLVENYFQYEAEISKLLSLYVNSCQMTIKKDSEFFRARIGYQHEERVHYNSKVETKTIYIPYSGDKIGAPPPNIVGTGRINRPGVSYLYCATDEYTAISEIRPHPGDVVSIGKFIVDKDLKIF
ncbi:MAG: hypothetical protein DI539_06475, partial [Flavobacterium psychrophilum]